MSSFPARSVITGLLCAGVFLAVLFIYAAYAAPDKYKTPASGVVSWCAADVNYDGKDEVLAIVGEGTLKDMRQRYGQELLIYDLSALETVKNGRAGQFAPLHSFDLTALNPMRVMAGDIDGDGIKEIGVQVYKATKFYPTLDKRPFFYRLAGGELVPVWLGSRLSRPFDDYILADVDGDQMAELVSIERLQDGTQVICTYKWDDFGFELVNEQKGADFNAVVKKQ
ncbi:MAG: hypothetical protein FWC60_01395 [Firmicutes bacterium]|nr:hypothetical protein [Bacillota bacterium]